VGDGGLGLVYMRGVLGFGRTVIEMISRGARQRNHDGNEVDGIIGKQRNGWFGVGPCIVLGS